MAATETVPDRVNHQALAAAALDDAAGRMRDAIRHLDKEVAATNSQLVRIHMSNAAVELQIALATLQRDGAPTDNLGEDDHR